MSNIIIDMVESHFMYNEVMGFIYSMYGIYLKMFKKRIIIKTIFT